MEHEHRGGARRGGAGPGIVHADRRFPPRLPRLCREETTAVRGQLKGMQTAHIDRFVIDRLPAANMLPEFRFDLPEFQYAERLNAAAELIDRAIAAGWGSRTAVIFPE